MEAELEVNVNYRKTEGDTESNVYYNSAKHPGKSLVDDFGEHGISRPKYQDNFLVDRKKLESMIVVGGNGTKPAEDFFSSIMEETNTTIQWPRRLKIGAKSMKDPFVCIYGEQNDVKNAKRMVLAKLDTKKSQVTIKIDVGYTEHSHIIGKGGQTIRQVVEETGCHIHFPDSNRSNPNEKSNQVSITGSVKGVEMARQQVRMLTPVKFSFELPAISAVNESSNSVNQIIEMVQQRYSVRVHLRKSPKLFSDIIIVKGSEEELVKIETATRVLIQQLCNTSEGEVPVQMTMEISPQHHSTVRGFNNCNLKEIMMQTSTIIIFPDALDPNLPPLKKSTVTISGSIHNVYLARQRLLGSLPLVLIFEVSEEQDIGRCNKIMELLNVIISMRLKPKFGTYAIHIKGLEQNAEKLYKSRQMLLDSSEPPVLVEIPQSYLGHDTFINTDDSLASSNVSTTSSTGLSPMASPRSGSISLQGIDSGYGETHEESSRPVGGISINECGQQLEQLGDKALKICSDYEEMQAMAVQAMQDEPVASKSRLPNSKWSGFGFSHSMPGSMLKSCVRQSQMEKFKEESPNEEYDNQPAQPYEDNDDKITPYTPSITTDGTLGSGRLDASVIDLISLLKKIGMTRYSYIFTSQKVDFVTFTTLNENDLRLLGIPTNTTRQKILRAISELRKLYNFNGGTTPSAETKG